LTDKNLYANDLIHRYASHTFTETTVGSMTKVEFKNAGSVVIGESQNLSVIDAYRTIRNELLEDERPLFLSTTTQRDALTNIDTAVHIHNITVGRDEVYDGTKWQNVSRRSVFPNITASTTQTQGNGLLSNDMNIITTVANNDDTVTLPTAVQGITVVVVNKGTKKIKIFPNTGDNLGQGLNSSVSVSSGSMIIFYAYDATNWVSS